MLINQGRESRDREYKGASGQDPYAWDSYHVRASIARTCMGMANIGGGSIVIGMDEIAADRWEPNGIDEEVDLGYRQDPVQQFVNQHADPFVELTVNHLIHDGKRFVIIEVLGFRELPVVCTQGSRPLSQGAVYTRSHVRRETVVVQSQLEMREMLDRAIEVGVQKRLAPVFEAMRDAGILPPTAPTDEDRFRAQRGEL